MKKIMMGMLALGCSLMLARAAGQEWMTDLPKAQAKAKTEGKMLLLDFTGSDWCGWCIKFDKEVLSTADFKQYAAKNLVLVEVDFPNHKPQTPAQKKANRALQEKYKADGFPTFVVLNKEGKEVGRQEGYEAGGPKAFIAKLEQFKKKS